MRKTPLDRHLMNLLRDFLRPISMVKNYALILSHPAYILSIL